ncbi:MAG TPA: EAL domain-containing protein [Telluria sp.]|nr:EAL domain-containing protein [Telluria sp.]
MHTLRLSFWPVLALVLCACVWSVTISRANAEWDRATAMVNRDAGAYADAYEQYVSRAVGQMDQVTMQLKHSWEHTHNPTLIEDLKRNGMFTDSAYVDVSVIDRNGAVRSSTHAAALQQSLAHTRFFANHRDNISTALRIGVLPGELAYPQEVVLFTRRLDTADDEFDGVVLLAVDARYFTSFVGPAALGKHGIVAMVGAEGKLRIEQRGDGSPADARATSLLPRRAAIWGSDSGVHLVGAKGGFADGIPRVLGWRHSTAYPLVALVGLPHQDAVAGAQLYWHEGRNTAILASACLLLLGALAAIFSARAAARIREQDEVRNAYRTATESANDGFYMAAAMRDRQGRIVDFTIVDCNERGAFFYGMQRRELVGTRLSLIDSGLFGEELVATYRTAMEHGYHEDDRRMPSDNRLNIRWGHRRIVRVGNGLAVTLQDVSERKAHEAQLERMANEDSLTALPNRHWLLDFIPRAIDRARAAGSAFAILFIDLDEFKHVNDSQGHAVGDQLLQSAAQRLSALLRPSDHVIRFGGDEFIVVLDPYDGDAQVAAIAARIVNAFTHPFSIAGDSQMVGASVGISVFPRDGADAETLIKHSDIAMYAGKSEGKGQFRFFDPALSATLKTRAQLKHGLLEAIEREQFMLHYQPRVDTRTGELLSMEALLRWRHPLLGMVPPADFIPLAEASGLILRIGELVIDMACAQLAAWKGAGANVVPVSINVSPKQFKRGGVKQHLTAALQRHGVAAALLEVEITESAMMGDQDEIIAELAAIRSLGVKLHVDDFGTGYSSLSQLQRLKMDVLKVDRAFTAELGKSREGRIFFQAIVSMAHALEMSVVAEGVETAQQLDILKALDCNEVQGYFIARPAPADEMLVLMERGFLFDATEIGCS